MKFNFENRENIIEFKDSLEKKSKFSELKRQVFHIAYGLVIIYSVLFLGKLFTANILTMILFVGGILSYMHIKSPINFIDRILNHVERDNSLFPGKGGFFFTFGALMTLYIFPENVALAGISILTFGDSCSHLFGLYIRKKKYNNPSIKKMIEGTIAGVIIASVATSFFVEPLFGLVGAVVALFLEFIENFLAKLDDNFYVPLIASAVIFALQFFLG